MSHNHDDHQQLSHNHHGHVENPHDLQQQPQPHSHHTMIPMTTGSMDHMMKMYFHFGYEPIVLFEQWSADSFWSLFLTCLFFFMMAILYEILKAYRRIHSAKIVKRIGMVGDSSRRHHHHHHHQEAATSSKHNHSMESEDEMIGENSMKKNEDPTVQIKKFNHPNYGMRSSTTTANNVDTESNVSSQNSSNNGNNNNNNGLTSSNRAILPTITFEGPDISSSTPCSPSLSNQLPLFVSSLKEMFNWRHIFSTFLYMIQVFFAYYLMLAFMLFNIWICLSIILGAALGHFLLAEQNMAASPMDQIVEDYCH